MSDDAGQSPKKPFEPPPWEREQYEELARRRADEQRADAALDELAGLTAPAAEPEPDAEPGPEPDAEPGPDEGEEPSSGSEGAAKGADEQRIETMLFQLSGEEGSALRPVRTASRFLAGTVSAIGTVLVVIALFIGIRSAGAGPLAATSMGVGVTIGAGLIGAGVWLWARAKR